MFSELQVWKGAFLRLLCVWVFYYKLEHTFYLLKQLFCKFFAASQPTRKALSLMSDT